MKKEILISGYYVSENPQSDKMIDRGSIVECTAEEVQKELLKESPKFR